MSNKLDLFILKLKPELGLSFKISFGIFLFILFFQPITLQGSDINNQLLVVSGFGIILLAIMIIIRLLSSWIFEKYRKINEEAIFPSYLNGFVIFLLSFASFAFYAHYVGGVTFTFTVAARIAIICLIPPVILGLHDSFHTLRERNEILIAEKKNIQNKVEKFEEDILNKTIDFISESQNENLSLSVSEVVFIRSSDNYVEIVYKEAESFKKQLIRNTLKNVESQIKQYSIFLRCHRTCIVNLHFIDKLHKSNGNLWLTLKGYDYKLPVSRQYLLKLQEAI